MNDNGAIEYAILRQNPRKIAWNSGKNWLTYHNIKSPLLRGTSTDARRFSAPLPRPPGFQYNLVPRTIRGHILPLLLGTLEGFRFLKCFTVKLSLPHSAHDLDVFINRAYAAVKARTGAISSWVNLTTNNLLLAKLAAIYRGRGTSSISLEWNTRTFYHHPACFWHDLTNFWAHDARCLFTPS